MVRITDRPDMTLDVYRRRKTTTTTKSLSGANSFPLTVDSSEKDVK